MANYISKQKGKVLSGYNKLLDHKTVNDVPTSEVNKLWRGMILINRVTSKLPKDSPEVALLINILALHSLFTSEVDTSFIVLWSNNEL